MANTFPHFAPLVNFFPDFLPKTYSPIVHKTRPRERRLGVEDIPVFDREA